MIHELEILLSYIPELDAPKSEYIKAIEEDNCLGKRSGENRKRTASHLIELYSLDPSVALFRALRYFWDKDEKGRPLLALQCAYARDPILRISAPFILAYQEDSIVSREELERYIDSQEPDRFSKATLKSTAQNLNSSWTQSGHLKGRAKKYRSRAIATAGSTAYALFMGYLTSIGGISLFETEYTKLLDCPVDKAIDLAESASRQGWFVFRRIEDIMEIRFPNLMNTKEIR